MLSDFVFIASFHKYDNMFLDVLESNQFKKQAQVQRATVFMCFKKGSFVNIKGVNIINTFNIKSYLLHISKVFKFFNVLIIFSYLSINFNI